MKISKVFVAIAILIIGAWMVIAIINYYTYYMAPGVFLVQKFDTRRIDNIIAEKSNAPNMTNLTTEELNKLFSYPENVINITIDELKEYPALEKGLNGINCIKSGSYSSLCKTTPEDWNKIKNFIYGKRNSTINSCYKFDQKYGEYCYTFAFNRP